MKASRIGQTAGVVLLCALSAVLVADPLDQSQAANTATAANGPEPWPDAKTIAERKRESENLRLFASEEPLAFKLIADFRAVNRDRNPASTKLFPAAIVLPLTDGTETEIGLQIRTRGHSRRKPEVCSFAPLRLEFQRELMGGTPLARHRAIKLGAHCRDVNEFEQYVLREYAVYKILNILTPHSFRARLAKATYIDAASKRVLEQKYAMFIEDDDDVAKRLEGRISDAKGTIFRRLDPETLTIVTLFEFMIGNTDMSISAQHNFRLVETPAGKLYPVPYDFDYSGLVDTTYSLPDKRLGINDVRERLYRGPCRTPEELETYFVKFREARERIYAIYDSIPDMSGSSRRGAKAYLDQFYRLIERPRDVKRQIIDPCLKGGM